MHRNGARAVLRGGGAGDSTSLPDRRGVEATMAFWIFACNPEQYRLVDRLADPDPTICWHVTRFREEMSRDDTAFNWETGTTAGFERSFD